jgi:hypothetical protein
LLGATRTALSLLLLTWRKHFHSVVLRDSDRAAHCRIILLRKVTLGKLFVQKLHLHDLVVCAIVTPTATWGPLLLLRVWRAPLILILCAYDANIVAATLMHLQTHLTRASALLLSMILWCRRLWDYVVSLQDDLLIYTVTICAVYYSLDRLRGLVLLLLNLEWLEVIIVVNLLTALLSLLKGLSIAVDRGLQHP